MTAERWQRIKEVLHHALELHVSARASFLARACAGDPEMLAEVRSLIASYETAIDFIEPAPARRSPQPPAVKSSVIGPYRLLEEIGHGGMGTVYRAVRADDVFHKEVAIKIVTPGRDTDFVVGRFQQERQIMATLEHPNIARLLDGGTTAEGLPYYVMEYIKGRHVDRYCDERRASVAERLHLFRTICSAVEFAHAHRIVHRDIKPGNILIDESGAPRLLDFGIAKALDPEFSVWRGDSTATIQRLMTPEYASPEQVKGDPVTAVTDIYSLGVLLYVLLTGRGPYSLTTASLHEIAEQICERDPDKPSAAIVHPFKLRRDGKETTIAPETVAANRGTKPDALRRALAGDLDNIVLLAMRKEPARRYASVAALSEDIRRHLEGLPVTARKDTVPYRASKFLRRQRAAVLSALGALVLITSALLVVRAWTFFHEAPWEQNLQPRIIPFTSLQGSETQGLFSPDGTKIVFVWRGENDDNSDIYVRGLDRRDLMRLTTNPAEDVSPSWSPDGKEIAFLRSARNETAIFVSPAENGVHRKIADVYPTRVEAVGRHLDWSPDGRSLAVADKNSAGEPFRIVLVAAETGIKTPVTNPPDNYIGDTSPVFSLDGAYLSFIRSRSSGISDLYVQRTSGGEARRLTFDDRYMTSQAWTPDNASILFSSNRGGSNSLWRVPVSGGAPVRLPAIGDNASDPVFSRDGRWLLYSHGFVDTNIWRLDLTAPASFHKLVASTQYDSSPQYSPDGTRIAFRSNRSGTNEIWISQSDGANPVQLTSFGRTLTGTPRWSPDSRTVAFDSRPEGQAEIYTMSAEGGTPRRVTNDPAEDVVPSWSFDGRWIYFASNRSGASQVWKAKPDGSEVQQVTRHGGFAAFESPDGRFLYYAKGRGTAGLWRVPLAGGDEVPVIEQLKPGFWGYWAVTGRGIYYVDRQDPQHPANILFYDLATGLSRLIAAMEKPPMVADSAFAVSADGRYILFSQVDQSGSDLMLADYQANQ